MLLNGWAGFGVRHVGNGGAVRIDEALTQVAGGAVGGICVSLEGQGEHVLRSVACQNNGSAGSRGISVVPPVLDTVDRVQIDDCSVNSAEIGIQLGDPLFGSVTDISVVNSSVDFASVYGIAILNTLSALCHVKGNKISTLIAGPGHAIWTQGLRHEVEGNHVQHSNINLSSIAVLLESSRTTFRGNTVEFRDEFGVVGLEPRLTIGGNEITELDALTTNAV